MISRNWYSCRRKGVSGRKDSMYKGLVCVESVRKEDEDKEGGSVFEGFKMLGGDKVF